MSDRETVMRGLACCIESYDKGFCPDECEYRGKYPECEQGLMKEALELLREQEPVSPIHENYWKHTIGRCGHCKAPLPALEGMQSKFCWMCGRAVKWDE